MARQAKLIDFKKLQKIITTVENELKPENLKALFESAATRYNDGLSEKDQIQAHNIYSNVSQLKIKTQGKKGKTSVPVDMKLLEACLLEIENKGLQPNRSSLWPLVAALYNKKKEKSAKEITHSVVMLRITGDEKLLAKVRTPMGKRGRAAGVALTPEQKAAMQAGRKKGGRAARFKAIPGFSKGIAKMRQEFPKRFHKLIDRLEAGSRSAGQALFCIQCVGYCTADVRNCTGTDCPMYGFRPFQKSDTNIDLGDGDSLEIDSEETTASAAA